MGLALAKAWVLECCLSFLCFAPGDESVGNARLRDCLKVSFPFNREVGNTFCLPPGREFACTSSNICPLKGKYWPPIFWDGEVMIRFVPEYDLSSENCLDSIGFGVYFSYAVCQKLLFVCGAQENGGRGQ